MTTDNNYFVLLFGLFFYQSVVLIENILGKNIEVEKYIDFKVGLEYRITETLRKATCNAKIKCITALNSWIYKLPNICVIKLQVKTIRTGQEALDNKFRTYTRMKIYESAKAATVGLWHPCEWIMKRSIDILTFLSKLSNYRKNTYFM